MPLADLLPDPETIRVGKGSVDVRALTLDDISRLLRLHSADMDELFTLFSSIGGHLDDLNASSASLTLIVEVIAKAPGLAANIIALAVGEDDANVAARLSVAAQVDILAAVARLTFDDYGGPGKFWATLTGLLNGLGSGRTVSPPPPVPSQIN